MRNFDNWNRYQDNQRNPLHGCIEFMVKDGNTPAPVFDSDGTALSNPQITDYYGRTQNQVFVDTDVVAYFYKYIGHGIWSDETDIDTSDVSKWSLQYTSESVLNILSDIKTDSAIAISNIAALRAVDIEDIPQLDGQRVITLMGYYSQGDKEPINYVWDPTSTTPDNGGSVIKSDDLITGRWIMVQPTEHCDSRHFGAFPSNSYNMADQTYQIGQLFAYCSVKDIRPYFNGSVDYRWFRYSNLNVIADYIDVTDETKFYDVGNNTIRGEWNGNPSFTLGNTNVVAKNVKTSWNAKTYTGYENVVIDVESSQKSWQDANIDVRYSPAFGYSFNHCVISENGNLGSDNTNNINNTFVNCKLNERMFILDGDYTVSLVNLCTNCQIDMDDFRNSMWLYKQIRLTSDSNPFFDYRDMPNVGKPIISFVGNKVTSNTVYVTNMKEYIGADSPVALETIGGQIVSYTLENCTGYYSVPAGVTLTLMNSNVKLRLNAGATVIATNSGISLDDTRVTNVSNLPSLSIRNSTLAGTGVSEYNFSQFSAYSSIVSITVTSKNSVVKDCQINNTFTMTAEPGTGRDVTYMGSTVTVSHFIHGYFDNNIFNAQFKIDAQRASTEYSASHVIVDSLIFQNNRSNLNPVSAWSINRLGAMIYDNYNGYTYINNTGGFECRISMTGVPIVPGGTLLTDSYNGMLTETTGQIVESVRWAQNVSTTETASYADSMTCYFTKMRMFIIGTTNAKVDLEITIDPNMAPGGEHHVGDMNYVQPNAAWVASGGTAYNYNTSLQGPSRVLATLTTDQKFDSATMDHSHTYIVPDLAKDPYSNTDEWQIRNFILGAGPGWFSGVNVCINLSFRQMDKRF